eukprot:gb/GEZN01020142.1/.p2 GENE.gb/GEZN01020142.1/~~gb/GEZN01020142.1/.p2  ORF type:complete len:181 (+),score=40.08 gb/GEZN01020142.1/:107-649(+)
MSSMLGIQGRFRDLLESLPSIRKLEELNKRLEEKVQAERTEPGAVAGTTSEPLLAKTDTLKLPRIVVIGDENAGKSSTLERIAMVDVLPRSDGVCTRQPIILKLRYDANIGSDAPKLLLTIPGVEIKPEDTKDTKSVRLKIEQQMTAIREAKKGMVYDSEIVVEIHSNAVPTMDLVDLQG